jgi:hypothetical protein
MASLGAGALGIWLLLWLRLSGHPGRLVKSGGVQREGEAANFPVESAELAAEAGDVGGGREVELVPPAGAQSPGGLP